MSDIAKGKHNTLRHGSTVSLVALAAAVPTLSKMGSQKTLHSAIKRRASVFGAQTFTNVLQDLKVDATMGLASTEVEERQKQHGKNELAGEPPTPAWKIFLEQMSELLVIMLLIAAIVSAAVGDAVECVVIFLLVIGMAGLGTYQEIRAGESLDALASLSAPTATVIRDNGTTKEVDSTELVVGDIILLEPGRTIPADGRLVFTNQLVCAEAALTGESVGVKKDANFVRPPKGEEEKGQHNLDTGMCFMGCTVVDGRAKAVVTHTGMNTKMGEVAKLMNTASKTDSPLDVKLSKLGKAIAVISCLMSLIIFIVGITTERGRQDYSKSKYLEFALISIGLVVAAVPEALPSMVTIALSMGMKRMADRRALCRSLHGTVTLASVSVICSDKTGTLTAGAMTAVRVWVDGLTWRITGIGFSPVGHVVLEGTNMDDAAEVEKVGKQEKGAIHTTVAACAALCSNVVVQKQGDSIEFVGNMSEKPLVVAALKAGFDITCLNSTYPRLAENPFDSRRKMMSTVVSVTQAEDSPSAGVEKFALGRIPEIKKCSAISCVKGAPNFVLACCTRILRKDGCFAPLEEKEKQAILTEIDCFSSQALRVLAIAIQPFSTAPTDTCPENVEKDLVLVGMYASIDPERPEVKGAIEKAYNAGIRVVAISGDYTKTLFAICKNIGLLPQDAPETKVVDCETIRADGERSIDIETLLKTCKDSSEKAKLNEELATIYARLDKVTSFVDAFGRAKPADKITILKSLQRQGHIASMTGDGVNDAPALKQANIGVAMGITGTDAAKAASTMILVDDSFSTIVTGVEEGRAIFRNISTFIFMLLSENTAEVFFVLLSTVAMGVPAPLDTIQLLLLNLFTDGAPAVALAVEPGSPALMNEGPQPPNASIISNIMWLGIAIHATYLCIACMFMYQWALFRYSGSIFGVGILPEHQRVASTISFLFISYSELLRAYTARSLRESIFQIGVFSNRWMQPAVFVSLFCTTFLAAVPVVQTPFHMITPSWDDWMIFLPLSFTPAIMEELVKFVYRRVGFGIRPKAVRWTGGQEKSEANV